MCLNRSQFLRPTDSAYLAPSENPPMALRRGSTLAQSKTQASASSRYSTSVANSPRRMRPHVRARGSRHDDDDPELVRELEQRREVRGLPAGALDAGETQVRRLDLPAGIGGSQRAPDRQVPSPPFYDHHVPGRSPRARSPR